MSSLLGIDTSGEVMAAGVDIDAFVRNRIQSGAGTGTSGGGKKKVSKFFNLMMSIKGELASAGDPRAGDMEAIRDLAAQRWEKMTQEEKDQFKSGNSG